MNAKCVQTSSQLKWLYPQAILDSSMTDYISSLGNSTFLLVENKKAKLMQFKKISNIQFPFTSEVKVHDVIILLDQNLSIIVTDFGLLRGKLEM